MRMKPHGQGWGGVGWGGERVEGCKALLPKLHLNCCTCWSTLRSIFGGLGPMSVFMVGLCTILFRNFLLYRHLETFASWLQSWSQWSGAWDPRPNSRLPKEQCQLNCCCKSVMAAKSKSSFFLSTAGKLAAQWLCFRWRSLRS